jgi:hypothetical protein
MSGDTGYTGPKGQLGNPGLQGSPGMTGPTGSTGSTGTPGLSGQNGQPGQSGLPGISGMFLEIYRHMEVFISGFFQVFFLSQVIIVIKSERACLLEIIEVHCSYYKHLQRTVQYTQIISSEKQTTQHLLYGKGQSVEQSNLYLVKY